MKASEVIQMALDSGRYLTECMYLCNLIDNFYQENKIDFVVTTGTKHLILKRIQTHTLHEHLASIGIINRGIFVGEPEYNIAAMNFWNQYITELQAQGD